MRLIDADALHKALFAKQKWVVRYGDKHNEGYTSDQVHFAIDDAPTVKVVANFATTTEVVRCKDCIHYWKNKPSDDVPVCLASPREDAYCSEGERKEDETD